MGGEAITGSGDTVLSKRAPNDVETGGAAKANTVRDRVDVEHRQRGHYLWRSDCSVCTASALPSSPHFRRLPHDGVLAVDIASLSAHGPYVPVGAAQAPGHTYAQPLRSRAASDIRDPLLRMVAEAK